MVSPRELSPTHVKDSAAGGAQGNPRADGGARASPNRRTAEARGAESPAKLVKGIDTCAGGGESGSSAAAASTERQDYGCRVGSMQGLIVAWGVREDGPPEARADRAQGWHWTPSPA